MMSLFILSPDKDQGIVIYQLKLQACNVLQKQEGKSENLGPPPLST